MRLRARTRDSFTRETVGKFCSGGRIGRLSSAVKRPFNESRNSWELNVQRQISTLSQDSNRTLIQDNYIFIFIAFTFLGKVKRLDLKCLVSIECCFVRSGLFAIGIYSPSHRNIFIVMTTWFFPFLLCTTSNDSVMVEIMARISLRAVAQSARNYFLATPSTKLAVLKVLRASLPKAVRGIVRTYLLRRLFSLNEMRVLALGI